VVNSGAVMALAALELPRLTRLRLDWDDTLYTGDRGGTGQGPPAMQLLARCPWFGRLAALKLEERGLLHRPIGDLRGASAPHMTELAFRFQRMSTSAADSLAHLSLPRLSLLSLYTTSEVAHGGDDLRKLLRAWGGTLATLYLRSKQADWGPVVGEPLVSARLPCLRALTLRGILEEAHVSRLASAEWAPQLICLHLYIRRPYPHGPAGWARLASAPFDALREFKLDCRSRSMSLQALQALGAARWLPGLETCQVLVAPGLVAPLLGIPGFAALKVDHRLVAF
jgi:hypothetical protein